MGAGMGQPDFAGNQVVFLLIDLPPAAFVIVHINYILIFPEKGHQDLLLRDDGAYLF